MCQLFAQCDVYHPSSLFSLHNLTETSAVDKRYHINVDRENII